MSLQPYFGKRDAHMGNKIFKGNRWDNETLREWCIKGEQENKLDAYIAKNATPPNLETFKKINL